MLDYLHIDVHDLRFEGFNYQGVILHLYNYFVTLL